MIRVFTVANVLALGGFLMHVACTTTQIVQQPAEEPEQDGGKTTAPKKDGGTGTGEEEDPLADCKPAGTYAMGKQAANATDDGGVCQRFSTSVNGGNTAKEITITENKESPGLFTMKITGDTAYTLNLLLANDRCQLGGAEQPYTQDRIEDDTGTEMSMNIETSHIIDFTTAGATDTAFVKVTPVNQPNAKGAPCIMQVKTIGTKK